GKLRCHPIIILAEEVECALGSQKLAGSCVAQSVRNDANHVVDELLGCVVLVVAETPRQEKLRINEMIVLGAKFEAVLSARPGNRIRDLVGILFLTLEVTGTDRIASDVGQRYSRRARRATRIRELQGKVRVLQ